MMQHSISKISPLLIPPPAPHHPSPASLLLNLRPVLPSYYHHHHSDMKGEKQVPHRCQGETLISEHLHSPPCSSGCVNELPRCSLIGWHWKTGTLLMLQTSRLSHFHHPPPRRPPPLSSTYCHTQLVALEGSPLCWFVLLRHLHTVEFALRKKRDTEIFFFKYIINWFIHVNPFRKKNLLHFCLMHCFFFTTRH